MTILFLCCSMRSISASVHDIFLSIAGLCRVQISLLHQSTRSYIHLLLGLLLLFLPSITPKTACVRSLWFCIVTISVSDSMASRYFPIAYLFVYLFFNCYLRHLLASGEDTVSLGVRLSRCVCVRHISLGGEGNALYPVLSGCYYNMIYYCNYEL